MGKKIICALAVMLASFLVLPCLSVTASEYETTMTETGNLDVDVYAKAIYNWPENCYVAEAENGSYKVQMDDGTVITVTSENSDASLRLVVYSIVSDDAEAYAWIMDCTEGLGSVRLPYEIYFLDESGNRVEIGNASITVTLPDGYETSSVYQVTSNGTVSLLSSTIEDGSVSFIASANGFYVLVFDSIQDTEQSSGEDSEESGTTESESYVSTEIEADESGGSANPSTDHTDSTGETTDSTGGTVNSTDSTGKTDNSGNGGQARTGDAPIGVWIVLLVLSVGEIIILLAHRQKNS